uniref:Uncharacterized protein n=1 Tax=Rhizophora mucronata TaxID=61149 RepID=A0A2P2JFB5_RHIMU
MGVISATILTLYANLRKMYTRQSQANIIVTINPMLLFSVCSSHGEIAARNKAI